MKVSVLFFGATADAVGGREVEIDLADGSNADDAFAEIISAYPNLKQHKLLFAVNHEYADSNKIICNGDELAVFTAVSGG
ncbi:MAG TPA: MoaD/ThiS family protein [Pyrinomonadaceae bacterium]|nr:MoaD/ThiS family protein [Pyrinomonadaceae bacterium]